MLSLRFYGVRGSRPTADLHTNRYGGDTSCVVLRDVVGENLGNPLILDAGSGLADLANDVDRSAVDGATLLLSHLHWDHVLGLPTFDLVDAFGFHIDVYADPANGPTEQLLRGLASPPFFPVTFDQRPGSLSFGAMPKVLELKDPHCTVRSFGVAHTNPTIGFRVESQRSVVVYITDHQAPADLYTVEPSIVEACQGADLLIHDAQYTNAEFARKSRWGHSTYEYAVRIAEQAGCRRLAFFHHDPRRGDDELDEIVASFSGRASGLGVIAARQGMDILLP